jgi:hypothetical protein
MICHRLTDVMEGINHALHLAPIVVHVQVTLDTGPKCAVEVESKGLVLLRNCSSVASQA